MSWVPKLDFDDDIVSLESTSGWDETTTFHPRPKAHYEYAARHAEILKNIPNGNTRESKQLRMIAKVQSITKTEPLNKPTSLDDWQNNTDLEAETIAMMRHLGFGPTLDVPLNERTTVPTLPIPDQIYIMQSGKKSMPIYFGDKYFKLEPENRALDLPYFEDDVNTSSTQSTSMTDEHSLSSSASGKYLSSDLNYELLKVNKNASWSTINSNHSYEVPSEGLRDLSFTSSSSRSSTYQQPTRISLNLGDFIVTNKRQDKKKNKKNVKVVTPKELYDKKRSK